MKPTGKSDFLNVHVSKYLGSVEKKLSTYKKDHKPELLHRLRVNIKKVKTIFFFAEKTFGQSFHTKRLKPLFQASGKIRELQINKSILNDLPHPPKFLISQMEKREKVLRQQFIKNIPEYARKIKKYRKDVFLPFTPKKKQVKKYFKKQVKKSNKVLDNPDRSNLHDFRKKIKKIMYVYNILPKKLRVANEMNNLEMDKLQKKWVSGMMYIPQLIFFRIKASPGRLNIFPG